jgi:DNA polymerase-3 subunit epsilon
MAAKASGRVVVLDTETTGFSPENDRVIEIAAVEVAPRTGSLGGHFHALVNPLRAIPWGATKVHGIRDADVRDRPTIAAVADEFAAFVNGATIAIHNSSFDVKMLDAELGRLGRRPLSAMDVRIVDTVGVARELLPFLPHHSLDALCDALEVDRGERVRHGALLDAKLTAQTLPHLAREYDSVFGSPQRACAANAAPALLDEIVEDALIGAAGPLSAAGAAKAFCDLGALGKVLTILQRSLESRWDERIAEADWACGHFVARTTSSVSESAKEAATALLAPEALAAYTSQTTVRSLTQLAPGTLDMRLTLLEQILGGKGSAHELARDIVALERAGAAVGKAREAARDLVVAAIRDGFDSTAVAYTARSSRRTDYKKALREHAPDADLTPYTAGRERRTFRARRLDPCATLFGPPRKRATAA